MIGYHINFITMHELKGMMVFNMRYSTHEYHFF